MWREESGFLEMFLAYYSQFEENVSSRKAYRDFLLEVLCAHELSLTSISCVRQSTNQTQLEAAANMLEFPSTVALAGDPSNHGRCSSLTEATIQTKCEIIADDTLEFVGEMRIPSSPVSLAFESEMKTTGEMKTEIEAASCMCDGPWNFRHCEASDSEQPPVPISSEERGFASTKNVHIENETGSPGQSLTLGFRSQLETFQANASTLLTSNIPTTDKASDFDVNENKYMKSHMEDYVNANTHEGDGQRRHSNHICTDAVLEPEATGDGRHFACGFCKQIFSHKSQLQNHELMHAGDRPFVCKFCNKSFRQSSSLRVHERIHIGHSPFLCQFCSKSFNHSSNLRRHERIHTGDQPFVCNFCSKSFNQSSTLRMHDVFTLAIDPSCVNFATKALVSRPSCEIMNVSTLAIIRFILPRSPDDYIYFLFLPLVVISSSLW